jgi:RHS repeat-associated protein
VITTSYTYDVQDNLASVTDPNGNVTTYDYDDFGRMIRQVSSVTGTTTYGYDAAGNLTSSVDANGAATTRSYDAVNRVTLASATKGGSTETTTWVYDDPTANSYRRGRLSSMTDPTGTTTYSYDRRGLLRQESRTIEGATYVTSFGYDANGNRTGMTYPSGRVVTYTFDFADRPSTASSGGTNLVSASSYAPFGPLTELTQGNGAVVTRQFDTRYRIMQNKLTRSGTTLAQYDYGYDNAGNITSVADGLDATWSRTFGYDDLHRLTTADSGTALWGTGSYSYDRMGNMTSSQLGARSGAFAYSGTTPKLVTVTENAVPRSVTYDPAGNEAAVGSAAFTYTPRNSLASADLYTYTYDGRGVRTITATSATGVGVASVVIAPTSVTGGQTATGTVTLTSAPSSDTTVALSSDNSALATVPPSVLVASGTTSATFAVTTSAPQVSAVVTLRASLPGTQQSGSLTVRSTNLELDTVTIFPTNAVGGRMHPTGMVTLTGPAPAGGAVVTLTSSDTTAAIVPTSITVPAGQSAAEFVVTTGSVGTPTNVSVTGTYGFTGSASLTVTTCAMWTPDLAAMPAETVWFDDALPPGASGLYPGFVWDTAQKQSGTQSGYLLRTPSGYSLGFTGASPRFPIGSSESIAFYALLDPCNPPDGVHLGFAAWGTGWAHDAYWGQNVKNKGTRLGPRPPLGVWTRLEFPAGVMRLRNMELHGAEFATVKNGSKAWFDRVAKRACTVGTIEAPSSLPSGDEVWSDDAMPAGATPFGTWNWDTVQKASGAQSHHHPSALADRQHGFTGGVPLTLQSGDMLVTYALIDPCDPPQQIMLQWNDGSGWEHRAFWGANLIGYGAYGTASRLPMGTMPKWGEWVRLEVPATRVGLAGMSITGAAFTLYDGHVWFDRVSKYACTTPVPAAPELPPSDQVWFEDALPAGATPSGTWNWDTSQKASGTQAHHEPGGIGLRQHAFTGATATLTPGAGERLYVYAMLDPCDPPAEIMLEWHDGSGWEHRAYWGANLLSGGNDGTTSRRWIGPLPKSGEWVRLEVPAAEVGLEGVAIKGMSFKLYNGHVWFDRAGKSPSPMAMMVTEEIPLTMVSSNTIDEPSTPKPSFWARLREWPRARRLRPKSSFTVTMEPAQLPQTSNTAGVLQRYSFYTPELNLMAETQLTEAATPTIEYEYVWFNGEPLAQIETATGAIDYYFNDHLGAPMLTTNSSGVVDWRVEREPYGSIFATRAGAERHQPLSLPGQEHDPNQPERAYNIFRWYRPGWGRYTQADRFLEVTAREPNLFAYVNGSPTRKKDPLGLFAIDGSCDCRPNRPNVPRTIAEACKLVKKPKCREIADRSRFVPLDRASRGTTEPLGDCLARRCSPDNVGKGPIRVFCKDSPKDCGWTAPAGDIVLYNTPAGCPGRMTPKGPERDWSQTFFHEMMHTCGADLHNDFFMDVVQVCTGTRW